jgi:hypothetical protein
MWGIEIQLYVFLITYYKRFHPKIPFYEKMKMTKKKRTIVFESFVVVDSFDHIVIAPYTCWQDYCHVGGYS